LERELAGISKHPAPERVHKFRTNSRRLEALLSEVVPELSRNDKKLLKLLARLRKKAGRVRDLDVQIASLRALKVPDHSHKSHFMAALVEERVGREKKLVKAFDRRTIEDIRKRLKRASQDLKVPKEIDPLAVTLERLARLSRSHAPLTERTLHQYRIVGKRARYIAELAKDDPTAKAVIPKLKHMQDVIGDWHDWLKLSQKAEELFIEIRDSSLLALLHNVTRAKFRLSLDAVSEIRMVLPFETPSAKAQAPKPAQESSRPSSAVA
jgi:CHAD domain-containing protein